MKHSPSQRRRMITNRLWRYRTALQLSQKQLAQTLGHKNTAHVSRWENGAKTPTLDNALMLAHILKVPVETLFADRAVELKARLDARASNAHDERTRTRA